MNNIYICIAIIFISVILIMIPIFKYDKTHKSSTFDSIMLYTGLILFAIGAFILIVVSLKISYMIIRNYCIG